MKHKAFVEQMAADFVQVTPFVRPAALTRTAAMQGHKALNLLKNIHSMFIGLAWTGRRDNVFPDHKCSQGDLNLKTGF